MSRSLTFIVYGDAKPQGSKRAFVNRHTGKPAVVESAGAPLREWRQDVKAAARDALIQNGGVQLEGPLVLEVTFWLRRPKHTKNTWPVTRPDLSKLVRALEDAMQDAGLFRDDSQIVFENVSKQYTEEVPRAAVRIEELP